MSRLVLFAGQRFGRFAILLFVLPLLVPLGVWLYFLDTHPLVIIAGGAVAIPAAMLSLVLLIGMVFAGFRRRKIEGVSRQSVPRLWQMWEDLAGRCRASRTKIVLSPDLNASIGEERPFLGLLGRWYTLTIGIPLLAVTDEPALAAILAHEDAHLRNKDTNGGLNMAEFDSCFEMIFDYAPPGRTVSGTVFYWMLSPLSKTLEREENRLSRRAEIEADRHAAQTGDALGAARALLLVGAASMLFKERVDDPLRRELLGSMTAPEPPLARTLKAALDLTDAGVLGTFVQKAWHEPDDEASDHPPWPERLAALGYNSPPTIEPVRETALSKLLRDDTIAERIRHFDGEWTSRVSDHLDR
ncbi:M48 family metallopeptidase [Mesorhizobium sp.]|uniref:M48 family metallopeptidase n=1 Tax=Mesorhizobium sp. TaxID=1871066 RepID=UPI0025EB4CDB|nr:M48 family metallopeptidase [Mesorhizobium sp.]